MKDLIKTVALEVWPKVSKSTSVGQSIAVEFATAFLAELSKRAKATAYDVRDSNGDGQTVLAKYIEDPNRLIAVTVTKLFAFPLIHDDLEAIENRVAEA